MGGSTDRMKNFAEFIQTELKDYLGDKDQKEPCINLSKSDRYVLYKVGPVLSANVSDFCLLELCFTYVFFIAMRHTRRFLGVEV